ncbi:DEAD/DEAH box helicase [Parachlamydia sp. AcF125]|uniref:DEAD/DEAH box helicase n=1 Tax=Parachlamydia sp. AcF125 TaxID=2795736 RepID=UPI001BC8D1FA|nr:DEAD/DEAH box helicase [Parachlamydia sp. AcF125]MBS4169043.1 ATP-dependent RNA helicase CshA [Parachlamydia sp. AcF125]
MTSFLDFGLDPTILKALEKLKFHAPSPIQKAAIPHILQKKDLIALAKTGSGKTAACAIPICDRVDVQSGFVQALIVVPTRELALQYATETQKIGAEKGVKTFALLGGEDAALQQSKLKHGVQVLVATPGRLIDFIYSRQIDLTHVETLILDEADEMLSMGFYEDLEFIIHCLVHEHQTLLFSATMPNQIRDIAKKHMQSPLEISLIGEDTTPDRIEHRFLYCRYHEKEQNLIQLIKNQAPSKAIIFCSSRQECEKVTFMLRKQIQETVDFLHAGLSQDIRSTITNKFRTGKIQLLVATDVASRGLDFSSVSHVFIYHLAEDLDLYIHRAGRTGRYEKAGIVVTLVTQRELRTLNRLLKVLKKEPHWIGPPPPATSSKQEKTGRKQRFYTKKRKPANPSSS